MKRLYSLRPDQDEPDDVPDNQDRLEDQRADWLHDCQTDEELRRRTEDDEQDRARLRTVDRVHGCYDPLPSEGVYATTRTERLLAELRDDIERLQKIADKMSALAERMREPK